MDLQCPSCGTKNIKRTMSGVAFCYECPHNWVWTSDSETLELTGKMKDALQSWWNDYEEAELMDAAAACEQVAYAYYRRKIDYLEDEISHLHATADSHDEGERDG